MLGSCFNAFRRFRSGELLVRVEPMRVTLKTGVDLLKVKEGARVYSLDEREWRTEPFWQLTAVGMVQAVCSNPTTAVPRAKGYRKVVDLQSVY